MHLFPAEITYVVPWNGAYSARQRCARRQHVSWAGYTSLYIACGGFKSVSEPIWSWFGPFVTDDVFLSTYSISWLATRLSYGGYALLTSPNHLCSGMKRSIQQAILIYNTPTRLLRTRHATLQSFWTFYVRFCRFWAALDAILLKTNSVKLRHRIHKIRDLVTDTERANI